MTLQYIESYVKKVVVGVHIVFLNRQSCSCFSNVGSYTSVDLESKARMNKVNYYKIDNITN